MRSRITALIACALLASWTGCDGKINDSHGATTEGPIGKVDLNLRLPSGSQIDSVAYNISHANGYMNNGSVPVDHSTRVRFQIGHIPVATGYSIGVSAMTTDGEQCTSQPVMFAIQAGQTSMVMLSLHCGGGTVGTTNGNVRVDVEVTENPTCPEVDGLTAIPLEVIVGSSISLTAYATTPDATFGWSVAPATAGAFVPATGAATSFTCNAVGSATITLSVGGAAGCAASTVDLPIICSPSDTGGGGNGGASGAGSGGSGGTEAGSGGSTAGTGGAGSGGSGGTEAGSGGSAGSEAGTGGGGGTEAGSGGSAGSEAGTGGVGGTEAGSGGSAGSEAGSGGSAGSEAGTGGSAGAGSGGSGGGPTCDDCRNANCRDFLGVDLVSGCFLAINGDFGANTSDPNFLQDCIDTVACARRTDCAYDPTRESVQCYCGASRDNVTCQGQGPGSDSPCLAEWQRAARTTENSLVFGRFSDLSFPSGWATFLLQCDAANCNSAAVGDCTVP